MLPASCVAAESHKTSVFCTLCYFRTKLETNRRLYLNETIYHDLSVPLRAGVYAFVRVCEVEDTSVVSSSLKQLQKCLTNSGREGTNFDLLLDQCFIKLPDWK